MPPAGSAGAKDLYPLVGVVPIVNTPFTEKDTIDYASVERLIDQAVRDGVSGCIVPAVASEVGKLSDAERMTFAEEVIRAAANRIRVVVGVSDPDPARARRLAEHGVSAGADGILCAVPLAIVDDGPAVKRYFHSIAQVDVPMLMIQDLHWSGYGMQLDVIRALWEEIPAFRCLKLETVPAGFKMTQLIEATRNRMPIGCGWSLSQFIEALDRGAHFFNTTAINKPFVHVYRLFHRNRRDEARELFHKFVPYLAFAHQHVDVSVHFYKRYCQRRGLFATDRVRQPSLPFDAYHRRVADELIDLVMAVEDGLGG